MFSVVSAYQKIYSKGLISDNRAYFYCFSKEESPHSLIPDPESVFDNYEPLRELLFPIMLLDLSALNGSFNEIIPVLYHESTHLDYLIYHLDKNGKVINPSFMDYEGNPFELEDEEGAEPFEDGVEEVENAVKRFRGKYLKIIPTLELPGSIDYENALAFSDQVYEIWKKAIKKFKPKEAKDLDYFGPIPSLVQFSPEYPVWNKKEDAFYFVGQVKMVDLGLADISYFIFYHPESRTVAQLLQMT
jgi:hypothetical protein